MPPGGWKGKGNLRLELPSGTAPLNSTVWVCRLDPEADVDAFCQSVELGGNPEWISSPGPVAGRPRWAERLTTEAMIGDDVAPLPWIR